MSENFHSWVDRVAVDRESKPLTPGEIVKAPPPQPFGTVQFVQIEKKGFKAEVGKKGDHYIYHFYPASETEVWKFKGPLEDAFIQVFKNPEQVEAAWVEEFQSFAVRVSGWVHTVWGDELAVRVIDVLEEKLNDSGS